MGGEYVASDDGRLTLRIQRPDGTARTVTVDGFDPGEDVYVETTEGRPR